MANKDHAEAGPITIKKYANRRLYNTATSSYVTLDHLCQMVKDGDNFVVYDAKSGEDITRSVLTHIIVEEESKGQTLLPISFLRQLIGLYGDNMQWMVPRYLDYSMEMFARNQEQWRTYFQQAMSGMFPFAALDEMNRQNAMVFERAMQIFSPFPATGADGADRGSGAEAPSASKGAEAPPAPAGGNPEMERSLATLQQNMEILREQFRKTGIDAPVAAPVADAEPAAEAPADPKPAAKATAAKTSSRGRKTSTPARARATAASK